MLLRLFAKAGELKRLVQGKDDRIDMILSSLLQTLFRNRSENQTSKTAV